MAASCDNKSDRTEFQEQSKGTVTKEEDYGFYFFPERQEGEKKKSSFFQRVFYHEDINNYKCKVNVASCMKSNPMVKLLVGALNSHGCPVSTERHISCETCREKVSGGFDPKTMQVVICQNNVNNERICCNVLAHELLHAFDYCRAKLDFENLRHLACTEIRAANMNHCLFTTSLLSGDVSLFNVKKMHQICVKNKALQSMLLVRNVSRFDAMMIVDEVFDRCYKDTEPYGRRCFLDMTRAKRAYEHSRNYYDYD